MIKHPLILLLGVSLFIFGIPTINADIDDYIKAVCEQNGGEWSDDNMACKNFESETEQDNFADALMDRDEYDELVEMCEEKGGEWNDNKVKCNIENEEDRTAFEDQVCDDGNTRICQISNDLTLEAFAAAEYDKEACQDFYGDWEDGECKFRDGDWAANEDFFYKAVCKGDDSEKCEKHRLSIQDGDD